MSYEERDMKLIVEGLQILIVSGERGSSRGQDRLMNILSQKRVEQQGTTAPESIRDRLRKQYGLVGKAS